MHRILGSITSFSHVHKNRSIASVYYPLDAVLTVNTGPLVNSVATSRTMPSHGGKPVVHADWWEMLRSNYSSLSLKKVRKVRRAGSKLAADVADFILPESGTTLDASILLIQVQSAHVAGL